MKAEYRFENGAKFVETGMAKVVETLLARLRRAEAEIVLWKRENERLMRELNRKHER